MSATRLLHITNSVLRTEAIRNISAMPVMFAKATDPIQQLFLDKLRDYQRRSSGGKLVDPTPEIEKEWKQEMTKLAKQYGGSEGVDMTKFPDFKFKDVKLDPVSME
ncbi:ATP synthase-coupling factor 6, mitochondrial-like [Cimex lectularius]|uniref:ATP synthase-coupling factor 6, mitochondrial n=1 Tax=Cimex lectularius TaxID=79782 RepID=A0A8I6S5A6_CIMLE|nr:ATP synthase-coupling factor 6, mitochondrial-like [Cimex lectularius]